MDIVHHAMIGGIGFVALASQGQELAGLGFLAGSVFPDLDVAFMALGKRFYLKRHQGPTHSFLLAPLYAALLAWLPALEFGWEWMVFGAILAGLCIHVLLDLFNTFGIQLLWPLTPRRFCLDALFFIDTVAWLLTLGFYALTQGLGYAPEQVALGYAGVFAVYLLARLVLQRRTRRQLGEDRVVPTAFNPFEFLLFSRRDRSLNTATYNALTSRTTAAQSFPVASDEIAELANRSPVFRDMQRILPNLHIVTSEQNEAGTSIVAQDMAVRNFGGKFGRTELRFDPQGKLIHEMANI